MEKKDENSRQAVAIIVRTKDRPLLLTRAIKSIASQTMSNFVVVVVNDGGVPETLNKVLQKQAYKIKNRIKVIHNKSSIGMQAASNLAIKSVNSKYIAIHDDDDTWAPEFLEKTIAQMDQNGSMGVIVTTDRVDEKIENGKIQVIKIGRLYPNLRSISLFKMAAENYATPITFIYRRKALEKVGYYDESLGGVGDWDFGLRFLCHYDIDFLHTQKALAFYHHRPQATGIDINSVYTNEHKSMETTIANKYLRQDVASGKLGLGFIMNLQRQHKEDQESIEKEFRHLNEAVHAAAVLRESELKQEVSRLVSKINHVEPLSLRGVPLRKRLTRSIYGLTVDWYRFKKFKN